jgi:hypothetical protein
MKHLVKYLLPLICFVVFFCKADGAVVENRMSADAYMLEAVAENAQFCEREQDLCMARPTTLEAPQTARNMQRRSEVGSKHSCSFSKGGKLVSASTYINCQNNSKQVFSRLSEPSLRLTRLGKLII